MTNLLDNAVKFAGGAELVIETLQQGALHIVVHDNGPGIAQAELQAVMQPFYRVESSRNRASGGLEARLRLSFAETATTGSLSNK